MRIRLLLVMLLAVVHTGCGKSTTIKGSPPAPEGEAQKPGAPTGPGQPPTKPPDPPPKVEPPTPPPENPFELSFQNVNKRVFSVSCVSCHNKQSEGRPGKLNLESYTEIKENILRIYLETVITKRMPLESTLTEDQYKLLKSWLEADAPEVAVKAESNEVK